MNHNHNNHRRHVSNSQSGNVFLFILIGVALFAALAMVVSRGMRGQTTSNLSARQAELAAVDVLSYAQQVARTVDRLRQRGISENDISFENAAVTDYEHSPVQPAEHQVFSPSGGRLSWQTPQSGVNDGSPWLFTGESCVVSVGTGSAGCHTDNTDNEELIMVLPNIKESVCSKIAQKLGMASIPADAGGGYSTEKYVGVFADDTAIAPAGGPFNSACVSHGGTHYFYSVLIAR